MKYTPTSEKDLEQLDRWVELDPDHQKDIKGNFWLVPVDDNKKPVPGVVCLKVEDDIGAVFYIKLENAVRVYAQFPPETEVSSNRVSRALRHMFFFLGSGLKRTGYHEAFFDSISESLVSFFKKLHVDEAKNLFKVRL